MNTYGDWGEQDEILERIHMGTIGSVRPCLVEWMVAGQWVEENLR